LRSPQRLPLSPRQQKPFLSRNLQLQLPCVTARGNLRIALLLALAMAVAIAADAAVHITAQRIVSQKQNGEPGGSPFLLTFALSSPKRVKCTYVSRATRTARAVCSAFDQL
jgi:hypothetical protein